MTRGWPLFVLICVLAVMPLVNRTLGQIALAVMGLLYLLTLISIKQASADRRSREDLSPDRERGA